jgi:hypothetical protein
LPFTDALALTELLILPLTADEPDTTGGGGTAKAGAIARIATMARKGLKVFIR